MSVWPFLLISMGSIGALVSLIAFLGTAGGHCEGKIPINQLRTNSPRAKIGLVGLIICLMAAAAGVALTLLSS